jgi:hypothetical protein
MASIGFSPSRNRWYFHNEGGGILGLPFLNESLGYADATWEAGANTLPATAVSMTGGTLNGTSAPNSFATTAWFEWGTSPTLTGATSTAPVSTGSGVTDVPISQALTGLVPDTTYYFRAVQNNSTGTYFGGILFFITGPDIEVRFPENSLLVDGGAAVDLGIQLVGTPGPVQTSTIRNVGAFPLTGLAVTVDGTHAANFSVTQPLLMTLAAGEETTFTVQLTSPVVGTMTAALHVASNDPDENPFDIALTATGSNDAAAYTFTNSTGTSVYSLYTFGSEFTVDSACSVSALGFYDHNQDGISGSNPVGLWDNTGTLLAMTSVSNADALRGVFRYHALASPVALTAGQNYRIGALTNGIDASAFDAPGFVVDSRITFIRQRYSNQTGVLNFPLNDNGTSPGIFGAGMLLSSGAVAAPEIAVEQPAMTDLTDGAASVDFGTVDIGYSSAATTFTIRNTGSGDLGVGAITSDSTEFTVDTTGMLATVAGGGSTTFSVTFTPSATGARSGNLEIANTDADENPFNIALTGTADDPDTDGDLIPNSMDPDDDNDGYPDPVELANGSDSLDAGSFPASLFSIAPFTAAEGNTGTTPFGVSVTYTGVTTGSGFSIPFATLPTDEVLHYTLDESPATDGVTINDISGSGNSATLNLASGDGAVPGRFGGALSLPGNNITDYAIANPVSGAWPTTALTVSAWVKSTLPSSANRYFFSYAVPSADNEILFSANNVYIDGTLVPITPSLSPILDDGEFHHMVMTWDSAGGALAIYVDGVQSFTGTVANGGSIDGNGSLVLGQDQDVVGGNFDAGQAFGGLIDEVSVLTRALSPAEVASLASGTAVSPGDYDATEAAPEIRAIG